MGSLSADYLLKMEPPDNRTACRLVSDSVIDRQWWVTDTKGSVTDRRGAVTDTHWTVSYRHEQTPWRLTHTQRIHHSQSTGLPGTVTRPAVTRPAVTRSCTLPPHLRGAWYLTAAHCVPGGHVTAAASRRTHGFRVAPRLTPTARLYRRVAIDS